MNSMMQCDDNVNRIKTIRQSSYFTGFSAFILSNFSLSVNSIPSAIPSQWQRTLVAIFVFFCKMSSPSMGNGGVCTRLLCEPNGSFRYMCSTSCSIRWGPWHESEPYEPSSGHCFCYILYALPKFVSIALHCIEYLPERWLVIDNLPFQNIPDKIPSIQFEKRTARAACTINENEDIAINTTMSSRMLPQFLFHAHCFPWGCHSVTHVS